MNKENKIKNKVDEIMVKLLSIKVDLEALQELVEHSSDQNLDKQSLKSLELLQNEWRDAAEFVEY